MKLSISNIAWNTEDNKKIYEYLSRKKFAGIEIAPTKLFPETPYLHSEEAAAYFLQVKQDYNLEVSSMQSIWYGQNGNIFDSETDRLALQDYTFQAIDFASRIGCKNLVFGNPKARNKGDGHQENEVFDFFRRISDYAHQQETCISLEPNPVIYNTNFINSTMDAIEFCKKSNCTNLRINADLGTVIYNQEPFCWIRDNIELINHIHISEPYLKKIQKRELHDQLKTLDYDKYISIEMGIQNSIKDVLDVIDYVAEVFDK